jgi:predicted DNA-binding transcriptional regulator YafY
LRKLVRALPQTFRADAEAAAGAITVDSAGWGELDRELPPLVRVLQDAIVRRHKVRLAYRGRTREPSERLVEPWGLVDKDNTWYLIAGTDAGQRTFRVDRIITAEVTELIADRPADFDLAKEWQRVVEEMEQRRSLVSATLLIETRFLPILRDHFGRHFEVVGELVDGRSRVAVAAPTALDIARNLAGWGAAVEVEEPASVRAELGRIGAELSGRYEQ